MDELTEGGFSYKYWSHRSADTLGYLLAELKGLCLLGKEDAIDESGRHYLWSCVPERSGDEDEDVGADSCLKHW